MGAIVGAQGICFCDLCDIWYYRGRHTLIGQRAILQKKAYVGQHIVIMWLSSNSYSPERTPTYTFIMSVAATVTVWFACHIFSIVLLTESGWHRPQGKRILRTNTAVKRMYIMDWLQCALTTMRQSPSLSAANIFCLDRTSSPHQ